MLTAQPLGSLGWWPYDQVKDAAGWVVDQVKDGVSYIYNHFDDVLDFIQKYGCTIINNDLVVAAVAGGTALVATPAAGAAVSSGAAAGQQGCRYITVSQQVLDEIKRRSTPIPPPPGVSPPPSPQGAAQPSVASIATIRPAFDTLRQKYKAGSIARFNVTKKSWSIYSPLAGAHGLGVATMGRCIFGDCLGEGEVDPPVPPGFVKAGEEAVPPTGVPQAGTERDKKPFYKNPYFWLGVGGVAVVGTGGYYVLRRRRKGNLRGHRRIGRRRAA